MSTIGEAVVRITATDDLTPVFVKASEASEAFVKSIDDAKASVSEMNTGIASLNDVVDQMTEGLKSSADSAKIAADAVEAAGDAVKAAGEKAEESSSLFQKLWDKLNDKEAFENFGEHVKDAIENPLHFAGQAAKSFIEELGPMGTAAVVAGGAAAVLGEQVYEAAEHVIHLAHEAKFLGLQLGVSAEQAQTWSKTAELAGVNTNVMVRSFRVFRELLEASTPKAMEFRDAITAAGVSLLDENGHLREANELYEEAIVKIAAMTDEREKNQLMTMMGGARAAAQLKVLGSEWDELSEKVKENARILTTQEVSALDTLRINLAVIKTWMENVRIEIGLNAAGWVQWAVDAIKAVRQSVDEFNKANKAWSDAFNDIQDSGKEINKAWKQWFDNMKDWFDHLPDWAKTSMAKVHEFMLMPIFPGLFPEGGGGAGAAEAAEKEAKKKHAVEKAEMDAFNAEVDKARAADMDKRAAAEQELARLRADLQKAGPGVTVEQAKEHNADLLKKIDIQKAIIAGIDAQEKAQKDLEAGLAKLKSMENEAALAAVQGNAVASAAIKARQAVEALPPSLRAKGQEIEQREILRVQQEDIKKFNDQRLKEAMELAADLDRVNQIMATNAAKAQKTEADQAVKELQRQMQERVKAAKEQLALDLERERDSEASDKRMFSNAEMSLKLMAAQGQISDTDEFNEQKNLHKMEEAAELDHAQKMLAIMKANPSADPKAIAKAEAEIEAIKEKGYSKELADEMHMALLHKQLIRQRTEEMAHMFSGAFTSIIHGTQSVSQAFIQMLNTMLDRMIENLVMITAATLAHNATEEEATKMKAAKGAFHNTYEQVSKLPPPLGVVLAPVAAAAAFAAVMAFEKGGIVPADSFIFAHKREMVLPGPVSSFIMSRVGQESGGGGGGGNAPHIHYHAGPNETTASSRQNANRMYGQFTRMMKADPRYT